MKGPHLVTLFVITLLTSIAAFWVVQQQPNDAETDTLLLEPFSSELSALTRIAIRSSEGVVFDATLDGETWWARHLDSSAILPVDTELLSTLVDTLRTAVLIEAKTQNAQYYGQLGVEDVTAESEDAKLLTLFAGSESFSVIVGKLAASGQGSYVRLPDSTQSWLVNEILTLPSRDTEWLINPLSLVSLNQVFQVTRSGAEGWSIARDESTMSLEGTSQSPSPFILKDLVENETLKFATVIDSTLSAMLSNRFDSVARFEPSNGRLEPNATINFTGAQDSLTAQLFESDGNYFVHYRSQSKPWVNDWLFSLSSFSYNQLNKTRQDFLAENTEFSSSVD